MIIADHSFAEGEEILTQGGSAAEIFYLIKSGRCVCYIDGSIARALGPGGSFGEHALMYGGGSADETVKAAVSTSAWSVSRNVFERVVLSSAMERRAAYDSFLASVYVHDESSRCVCSMGQASSGVYLTAIF